MAIWAKSALLSLVIRFILLALPTTALVLKAPPASSLDTPQVIARAVEAATVKPYTGDGPAPVPEVWHVLSTGSPLRYTPTDSNITIQFTLKGNNAQAIQAWEIYDTTVLALANAVNITVITRGIEDLPRYGHKNSTFVTSDPRSNLQFMMTTANNLPVHSVTDVLRGMQELTHYLYFLEMVFEVFSDTSPTSSPIASGCLAFNCDSQLETVQTRDLEYVNLTAVNSSTVPSRRLQSSIGPVHLTTFDALEAVAVTYGDLKDAQPIHNQSFADVATRMLATMTDLILANGGDGLLPRYTSGHRPMLRYVDTWGSNLAISLFPASIFGTDFTLGQAARALQTTQDNLMNRPMVESRLVITLDGRTIGWGCLSYANASNWRCIIPVGGSMSSVGSQSSSGAANAVPDPNTTS